MIKNWNLFRESVDERSKIHQICKEYNIRNYTINDDLSIDANGGVDFIHMKSDKLPLNFKRVVGYFYCDYNLTSLIGSPQWVGRDFCCSDNKLTSLEYSPKWVGDEFNCNSNKITSLSGCPQWVGGEFHCSHNKLTSLEYLPKSIGSDIICFDNNIWSFRGIPDSFRGNLICVGNPIEHIWKLFESSGDIEFLNDCDVLREPETPDGKPIVILERLNFFLETIGKSPVGNVDGYINI
jgi:hypothetical protein